MYTQTDLEACARTLRSRRLFMAGLIAVLLAAEAALFSFRLGWGCAAVVVLGLGSCVAGFDLILRPASAYSRFLNAQQSALVHEIRGIYLKTSPQLVTQEGVYFREVLINIYKDRKSDGLRRFLLDSRKSLEGVREDDILTLCYSGNVIRDYRKEVAG